MSLCVHLVAVSEGQLLYQDNFTNTLNRWSEFEEKIWEKKGTYIKYNIRLDTFKYCPHCGEKIDWDILEENLTDRSLTYPGGKNDQ